MPINQIDPADYRGTIIPETGDADAVAQSAADTRKTSLIVVMPSASL